MNVRRFAVVVALTTLVGELSANLQLSRARAKAVVDALAGEGRRRIAAQRGRRRPARAGCHQSDRGRQVEKPSRGAGRPLDPIDGNAYAGGHTRAVPCRAATSQHRSPGQGAVGTQ